MIQTQLMEQLAQRIAAQSASLQSEEATKHALVLPFLQAMGYDPFNPDEIIPEYTADFGTKQGEKVDYAIMRDGSPAILIECKKVGDPSRRTARQPVRSVLPPHRCPHRDSHRRRALSVL